MTPADLYRLCARYVQHHEDAEDVAQDLAIKLWQHGESNPAHVRRIARTTAIDHWRRERVHSGELAVLLSDTAASAEREALAQLELREIAADAPWLVAYAVGYRWREIAAAKQEPESTFKVRALRYRERLQEAA